MTYYEELGISADASAEEIRQAHRRLVKLLHPDQHQDDDGLRRLAEIQLTRVNAIVAELLDPAARQAYDARPSHSTTPVPVAAARSSVYRWAACVISGLALVALLGVRSPTDVVRTAAGGSHAAPAETPNGNAAAAKVQTVTPTRTRVRGSSSYSVTERVGQESAPGSEAPPLPSVTNETVVTNAANAAPAAAPAVQAKRDPEPARPGAGESLTGTWLYAGGKPTERDKDLYRPEYIELRIRENRGVLRGEYRSRYAVTDLAISPSVEFTFEGKAGAESLRWLGPGGAAGTLTIRQLQRDAIEVDWKVTDFGSRGAGLEFGTATLIRRQ